MRVRRWWRTIRYWLWRIWSLRSPIAWLSANCYGWRLERHDWPYAGAHRQFWNGKTHYVCIAYSHWVSGRAIGHTPWQAARRALRIMDRRDAQIPRPTLEEICEMLEDVIDEP